MTRQKQRTTTPETEVLIRGSVEAERDIWEYTARKMQRENRRLRKHLEKSRRKRQTLSWLFFFLAIGFAAVTAPLSFEGWDTVYAYALVGAGVCLVAAWLRAD